jgi:phenylacetate-coenzyme A ligase PaaK-like adenylate-forming protein
MHIDDLRRLEQAMRTPEMLEQSIDYLAENMKKFLRPGDKLMLCFTTNEPDNIGDLLSRAAKKIGVKVLVPEDLRWKTMLKMAFNSRVDAISAPPFVVLGLTKLARHTRTPLYFHNVLTVGYRCTGWIIEGIQKGLDCQVWGCYGPGTGPLVSGFSCDKVPVLHVRDDIVEVDVVDGNGNALADGEDGYIVLTPRHMPSLRYNTFERGRKIYNQCVCGCKSTQLIDMYSGEDVDPELEMLGRQLMLWTSVLDCRLTKGESGLEVELVTIPGEKLPVLPQCAKRVVRNWQPETDVPNWFTPDWRKNEYNS